VALVSGEAAGTLGVRWRAKGEGRETLNEALARLAREDLSHLAASVAEGRVMEIAEPEARRWVVDTGIPEQPGRYRIWQVGASEVAYGPRADLVLAIELAVRVALEPHEGRAAVPPWVDRCRRAHVALLASLEPGSRLEGD